MTTPRVTTSANAARGGTSAPLLPSSRNSGGQTTTSGTSKTVGPWYTRPLYIAAALAVTISIVGLSLGLGLGLGLKNNSSNKSAVVGAGSGFDSTGSGTGGEGGSTSTFFTETTVGGGFTVIPSVFTSAAPNVTETKTVTAGGSTAYITYATTEPGGETIALATVSTTLEPS